MSLTVIKKKASSNKTTTLPKPVPSVSPLKASQAASVPGDYIPFIDKLSLTLTLPSDDLSLIYGNVHVALKAASIFQQAKSSHGFKTNRLIALPHADTAERVLFQFDKGEGKVPHFRIEFNPLKIGEKGITDLDNAFYDIFSDGWLYVVKHGRISRIDVAVDIPGVRMDDFLVLPTMGITHQRIFRDGHLETLYLGSKKGNQTRIYSKKKEQEANGKAFGQSVVRIERMHRNLGMSINELKTLSNPFETLLLTEQMPPPPVGTDEKRWSRFQDSVKMRGQASALALLPKTQKAEYKKHLEKHTKTWWNPKAIWAHWPAVVQTLK